MLAHDRHPRLLGLGQGSAQLHEQPFLGQAKDVGGGEPGGRLEKRRGAAPELQDLEVVVDQGARRGVAGQRQPLRFAEQVGRRLAGRHGSSGRHAGQPFVGQERQLRPAGRFLPAVDLVGAIGEFEQVAEGADRLGLPEDQEPAGVQREMEHRQEPFLQHRRHVDQHVPAGDEVDARERRVDGDVLPGEHAQVAHRLLDPVAALLAHEEPAQPLGRDLGLDAFRIDAGARLLERRRVAEIGGEDLQRVLGVGGVEVLEQDHRQRVGLLARRAARDPDADRRATRPSRRRSPGRPAPSARRTRRGRGRSW